MASIICGFHNSYPKFDPESLTTVPCVEDFAEISQEVEDNQNSTESSQMKDAVRKLQVLLSSPPQSLSATDITSAIELLSQTLKQRSSITKEMLVNAVTFAGHVNKYLRTSGLVENSGRMRMSAAHKIALTETIEMMAGRVELGKNETYYRMDSPGIDLEIRTLPDDYRQLKNDGIVFESSYERIEIPRSSLLGVVETDSGNDSLTSSNSYRCVFVAYEDTELFPPEQGVDVTSVISATVTDGEKEVSLPIEYSMSTAGLAVNETKCFERECKYYDTSGQKWSEDGCQRLPSRTNAGENAVRCECNHTTSFSVVINQNTPQNYALDVVSTIGLVISIVCLGVTIMIFLLSPELRRIRSASTHTNLCFCLLLAYFIFLVGIDKTEFRPVCITVAALIHFLLLSAWGWMAYESITMYGMFVRTFDRRDLPTGSKKPYLVYIISAFIVVATMGGSVLRRYLDDVKGRVTDCSTEDLWSSYVDKNVCWIGGLSLYFGFLMIVGVVLLFNIVFAVIIIRAITWKRAAVHSSIEEKPFIHVLRSILVALLLGAAWIFAVPLAVSQDPVVQEVFSWLFAITTFSQSIFIFYFFCLRRKDVRLSWIRPIQAALTFKSLSNTGETRSQNNYAEHQFSSATARPTYSCENIAASTISDAKTVKTTCSWSESPSKTGSINRLVPNARMPDSTGTHNVE